MSLFIIGSVNRVTSNIILQLARNAQYSSITIADLLPAYEHHYRYYRLQQDLADLQLPLDLKLTKLKAVSDLSAHQQHQDVLFVTHDYYQHVTSKTKLMELTAEVCQKRENLYYATPVEYDHFGFNNPHANYTAAQKKVNEIAPQATIIRSDVQDQTEAMAYINTTYNPILRLLSGRFSPNIVSSSHYANVVCNALKNKVKGKNLLVVGERAKSPFEVNYNKTVEDHEYCHAAKNIQNMSYKYNGLIGEGCEQVSTQL